MLHEYRAQLIFFGVFFAAAIPILYYIYRKNPHPRFRPSFGEMSVMTLIAAFICGGMAFGLGSLFKAENDGTSMNKKPDTGQSAPAAGGSTPGERKSKPKERKSDSDDGDEPPPRRLNDRN